MMDRVLWSPLSGRSSHRSKHVLTQSTTFLNNYQQNVRAEEYQRHVPFQNSISANVIRLPLGFRLICNGRMCGLEGEAELPEEGPGAEGLLVRA